MEAPEEADVDPAVLVHQLRSPSSGVAIKDRKLPNRSRLLRECFIGKEAVDWLLAHDLAPSRAAGVALLAQLQRECYIKPAGPCKRLPRPIDCDLAFFRFGASSASRIAAVQLLHDHALLKDSGGASGSPKQQQLKKDQQPAVPRHSAFFEQEQVSREFETWLQDDGGPDPEQAQEKSQQDLRSLFKQIYDIVLKQATIEDDEVRQAMRCMDDLCCTISLTHAGMTKERIRAIVFGLGGMYILTGLLRRLRRVALLQRKGSELVSLLLGDISSKGALTDVETSSVLPLIRTLGKTYHHYAPWGPNEPFDGQTWNEVNGALDILYNKGWRQEVARMRNKRLIKTQGRFHTFVSHLNKERLWERPLAAWEDTRRALLAASDARCTVRLWSLKVEDVVAKEVAIKVQQWAWNGQPARNQATLWSSAAKSGRWDLGAAADGDQRKPYAAFEARLYQELRVFVLNRRREESVFRKAKEEFVGAVRIEPATVHALQTAYAQDSLEVSLVLSREEETPSGPRYHSGSQLKRGRVSLRLSIKLS